MKKMILTTATILLFLISMSAFAGPYKSDLEPFSTSVSVSFADGSSTFIPDPTVQELLRSARDASMITINGRTSTLRPSARDERLALARAVSARNYLVNMGVSPMKIMINYVSAADFIADNGTAEGRYLNQRVDIELIYVPSY